MIIAEEPGAFDKPVKPARPAGGKAAAKKKLPDLQAGPQLKRKPLPKRNKGITVNRNPVNRATRCYVSLPDLLQRVCVYFKLKTTTNETVILHHCSGNAFQLYRSRPDI